MRKIVFIISAAALALVACGQAASPAAQPTAGGVTASPPTAVVAQPTAAAPVPTPQPTTRPEPTAPATTAGPTPGTSQAVRPPDALVRAAQQGLARYLGVSAEALTLQSAEVREWPDGSLGCPAADQVYPQVVTPGFLLLFSNAAQSQTYTVHTPDTERQLILCANGKPTDLSAAQATAGAPTAQPAAGSSAPALDENGKQMATLAQAALAQQLGIKASDVTLISSESREWRDSSLGCPKPDQAYLQVITPGYLVTLEAQGKRYEYHTDARRRVVLCEKPAP